MDGFIFANLVAHGTSTGADCASYEGAFAASQETTDYSASGCGATDNFEPGVMAAIMRGLSGLSPLVSGLS